MTVDYLSLISKHTAGEDQRTVPAFIIHSALVTNKALEIAAAYVERTGAEVDLRLLEEIGMLHDIGIFKTETPSLFTHGDVPYLGHLEKGEAILEDEGLPLHARAAHNHSGIPAADIERRDLPLRPEDHVPVSVEEDILHLADQFYSKSFSSLFKERSLAEVRENVRRHGDAALARFDALHKKYCD